ncbi:MAG: septal ring lytic transglycosylase RlpA family protein [Acidimicrobiales bacterium]
MLTLPLFFAHSATSQVPATLVAAGADREGIRSVQDMWADRLVEVTTTTTTSTPALAPTSPPTTGPPPRPHPRPAVVMTAPTTSVTTQPPPPPPPTSQDGLASWYELEGAHAGVCAHRSLPFGTVVTVTAVRTGASLTCVVGDRGPFAADLVVDLFRDDFAVLAPLGAGIISVHLTW